MPLILSTGKALIDSDKLISEIGTSGAVFVDVCAGGHGHFVLAASRARGESGRVIALDAIRARVNALRSRLAEYGHENVEVMHEDIESKRGVSLKDSEIDIALLANSLQLFSSPVQAISELRRIIKLGGKLVFVSPKSASPFFALAKTRGISEDTAKYLFEDSGFALDRRFDAGPHHICLVLHKTDRLTLRKRI
ncbi:MAG: methyltransferase domain-containing protein [bacterium]